MLRRIREACKERWKKLFPPIKNCKICFKRIKIDDFCRLFDKEICICNECQIALNPKFIRFKVDTYSAIALYEYNAFVKKLIYLYKGCFDYELKDIFLNLYYRDFTKRFANYIVIPIPSHKEDDQTRGFNHVIESFQSLGLKIIPALEKTAHHKQAKTNAKNRKDVRKYLRLADCQSINNRKLLIVDDIYTTGSTMKSAINILEKQNPKDIKILVLAKTSAKTKRKH